MSTPRYRSACLIIIDTLRADRLLPWGGKIPFFDGRAYTGCISASGWTLLSIASILTGKYPREHGLTDHFSRIGVNTLPEVIRSNGFYTAGIFNNNNIDAKFGFAAGFDTFDNSLEHEGPFAILGQTLKAAGGRRSFFVFHTNLVHDYTQDKPYYRDARGTEPIPPGGNKPWMSWPAEYHDVLRKRYDRGIRYCLKRIRKEVLPLFDLEETLVAITSDHGEGLFSPRVYHEGRLHNDLLNVPLVVLNESGVDAERFSQTGLISLLAGNLGIDLPKPQGPVRAEDLAYIYRHDLPPGKNRIDYKSSPGLSLEAWYDGRYKTIAAQSPVDGYSHVERYDVEADWQETNNLAVDRDRAPLRAGPAAVSSERMREHGERCLENGRNLMEASRWEEADQQFSLFEDLFLGYAPVDEAPLFRYWRGLCKEGLGDFLGALSYFDAVLSSAGGDRLKLRAGYRRGVCRLALGQYEAAEEDFAKTIREADATSGPDDEVEQLRNDSVQQLRTLEGRSRHKAKSARHVFFRRAPKPIRPVETSSPADAMTRLGLPAWAGELASITGGDERLPASLDGVNLVLNRARLAAFLAGFAEDKDVRDFLASDVVAVTAGLPLTSTGLSERVPGLALRPFRIWEYVWLYKVLGLSSGGIDVLDLGGSASHLSILAAIAGCRVTTIDVNPEFVRAAAECARALKLESLAAQTGDMRDLSRFPDAGFDVVVCCSVLEHLTARDQERAMAETARVLKPGGIAGVTFDYGPPAPGANIHLPPPHEPPQTAAEVLRRYQQGGLLATGNLFCEDSIPGVLFHDERVAYTIASLFLAKPPVRGVALPVCQRTGSVLGGLTVEELPYKLRQGVGAAADMEKRLAAQKRTLEEEADRVRIFEGIAEERLTAMQQKELTITELSAALAEARRQLDESAAGARLLERAAEERLAAMLEKERVIAELSDALAEARRQLEAISVEHAAVLTSGPDTATQPGAQSDSNR